MFDYGVSVLKCLIMHILFIDALPPNTLEQTLKNNGFEVSYFEGKDKTLLFQSLHRYDGLVIRSKFVIDRDFLDHAPNLKFIARAGAGMENIDVKAAKERGIQCLHSPEGNRDAVAEQAIGMLLMLFNRLRTADQEVREGIWRRFENMGTEIMAKTIGIIGYGNTGSRMARKLAGFDANILIYDKYKSDFGSDLYKEASLEEIYRQADILSLHIPLTDETKGWINDSFIHQFHKPFYLINTSRGQIVQTDALVRALQEGKILGACLDVIEYESYNFDNPSAFHSIPAYQYLLSSDKVIMSPHIAGWTHEAFAKMNTILAEKIIRYTESLS